MAQDRGLDFIVKPADDTRGLHAPKSELEKAEKIVIDFNEESKTIDSSFCKKLLSDLKVQHYLRDETELVTIHSSSSISNALKTLVDNHVHSAPVYDMESNTYLGFIDLLDIVSWVVCNFDKSGRKIFESDIFSSLRDEERWFSTTVKEVIDKSGRNPFQPVDRGATLLDVAKIMAISIHSIPVVDYKNNSFLGIITQSQIIQILCENLDQLGEGVNKTLADLDLSPHTVLFTKKSDSALDAFKSMQEWKVHGIPILSDAENQVLVGNLSASDMRILIHDKFNFSSLYIPVYDYVRRIRKEFAVNISPVVYCLKTDTLANVIRILAANHLHRLYVVDKHMKILSVVSLCDILRVLYAGSSN